MSAQPTPAFEPLKWHVASLSLAQLRLSKFAILMGDYCDRGAGFISLTYYTKQLAFAAGLRQHCTDIVRFSHGASSSRKVYRSSFIPGLHDMCMVFEKP